MWYTWLMAGDGSRLARRMAYKKQLEEEFRLMEERRNSVDLKPRFRHTLQGWNCLADIFIN